jgi:cell cycle sensor histidine kinase DivJ
LLAPFVPGAALMIAIGFSAAAIRAARTHDNARAEAEHGRLRAKAFDASPAALLACDAQGNILAASAGMRSLSPGLPRRLDSLPAADLGFDDPDRAGLEAAARDAAHRPVSASYELRGEQGRPCVAQVETAPIEGGSVIVFAEDVAADAARRIRQAEAERDAAIEEARAKSQYLASVSHELRTPLNAIIGFSDVMKARLFGPLPARYSEYAQLIHESGRHLMELIGDVLDMSKIEADRYELALEKFDVGEVIGICTKLMRLQAEESGLTLSADGVGEAMEVTADRKALRQIILNLLSNAVKFTPEGGAVVVMARASGDDLVLAVGDSGVGIASAEIDRLGRPYQQAGSAQESTQRGTGLGLSLVRALAELHGGRMNIVSRQGEGTTVTLTLPILAQRREAVVEEYPSLEVHDRIRLAQTVGADLAGEHEDDRASASS